jgi:uncharacterized membrane protein
LSSLAAIRPHDWDIALFLHVLGAMVATGGLILALVYLTLAWRGQSPGLFRYGFRALLFGAVPGYVVMRVAAQWIVSKEGLEDSDHSWIGIGFAVGDLGLLFLLIATITAGVSSRRNADGSAAAIRVSTVATAVLLVAYVIAVWAMTTKPV